MSLNYELYNLKKQINDIEILLEHVNKNFEKIEKEAPPEVTINTIEGTIKFDYYDHYIIAKDFEIVEKKHILEVETK